MNPVLTLFGIHKIKLNHPNGSSHEPTRTENPESKPKNRSCLSFLLPKIKKDRWKFSPTGNLKGSKKITTRNLSGVRSSSDFR